MKPFSLFFLLIICNGFIQAQDVFYISPGTEVFADGNQFLYLEDRNLEIDGSLFVDDAIVFLGNEDDAFSITNNGVFTFSRMVFQGINEYQTFGEFSGSLELEDQAKVHLVNGFINLNNLVGETNVRSVTGQPGTYLVRQATNVQTSNSFGNIGIELISADNNLGTTTVYRRFTSIDVDGTDSIDRYYEITPSNNDNLNATARFYFLDPDLAGYLPEELSLYKSEDSGATWTNEMGVLSDTGDEYYLEKSGINNFSIWAIAESGMLLPVELVFFEAEAIDNSIVLTTWQTATEVNNRHFEVERSQTGNQFEQIGVVAGNGTTQSVNDYEFTDSDPYTGYSYYRLKQVDEDGEFDYSDRRQVYIERATGIVLFPNPAREIIQLTIPENLNIDRYRILRLNGEFEKSGMIDEVNNSLQVQDLAAGMYLLELSSGSEIVKSIKFIKE